MKITWNKAIVVVAIVFSVFLMQATAGRKSKKANFKTLTNQVRQQWFVTKKFHHLFNGNLPPRVKRLPSCQKTSSDELCRNHIREMNSTKLDRLNSFSPYEFCVNIDRHRFPSKIVQTRCLCEHCLDYNSKIIPQLLSKNISVSVKVIKFKRSVTSVKHCNHKTCDVVAIDVPVGCHCAFRFGYSDEMKRENS